MTSSGEDFWVYTIQGHYVGPRGSPLSHRWYVWRPVDVLDTLGSLPRLLNMNYYRVPLGSRDPYTGIVGQGPPADCWITHREGQLWVE